MQKELSDGYVQSQDATKKLQEEAKELWKIKEQLAEEKEQEIAAFKQMQAELQQKGTNEITELKKEKECLIFKKVQLYASCREVEQAIDEACQHIYESTMELTTISKSKRLGEVISQLQLTNILLNYLVYLDMPPEQIVE